MFDVTTAPEVDTLETAAAPAEQAPLSQAELFERGFH